MYLGSTASHLIAKPKGAAILFMLYFKYLPREPVGGVAARVGLSVCAKPHLKQMREAWATISYKVAQAKYIIHASAN